MDTAIPSTGKQPFTAWMLHRNGAVIGVNCHPLGAYDEDALDDAAWLIINDPDQAIKEKALRYMAAHFLAEAAPCEDLSGFIRSQAKAEGWSEELAAQILKAVEKCGGVDDAKALARELKDNLNYFWLRARYGGAYDTAEGNHNLYFRISSKDRDWYGTIMDFVSKLELPVETVTVQEDPAAMNRDYAQIYWDKLDINTVKIGNGRHDGNRVMANQIMREPTVVPQALKFIESADMRAHVQTPGEEIDLWQWCQVIAAARAPLEEKAAVLRKIAETYHCDMEDLEYYDNPSKMADAALAALHAAYNAPPGSVFMLTQCNRSLPWAIADHWRFDDFFISKYSEVFTTFAQALDYIAEEWQDEDAALRLKEERDEVDYSMYWNEIDRYDLMENGKLEVAYTWYVSDSGVIWGFDAEDDSAFGYLNCFSPYSGVHLPTPFIPGDIVTVDCRPYYGVFHGVVVQNGFPADCCSPTIVTMCDYGRLECGAFHHSPHDQVQRFPPVLRAARFEGKLPKREAPLKVISDKIKDNLKTAQALHDWLFDNKYKNRRSMRASKRDCEGLWGIAWKDVKSAFGWE